MSAIPHETTLLPASAGTGKTFRIVDLLRDLVLDEGQDLRRVVVVTFTEAAAGELRDRIRERFVQAREGLLRLLAGETWKEPDESIGTWVKARVADRTAEEKAERAWQTLVAFDTCCITTIHGFCARVLTEAAFEAGAPFATEMLGSTDPLFEAVVDDFWLRHTHDAPVATLTSFHALGITRKVMRDVAKKAADPSLIIAPDDPGTPEPVDLGPWFDLLRAAHRAVEDHGDTLVGTVAKSPTIHSRRDSAKGITAAITANRMG
ncbi:MAG: UvrD-helicase domain-containing protein, partial [Myxococcales bacterium]|nr:UvrD-helicase domain-containing protein [Myxococcales bacterium]